jgi:hypothetical protein
MLRAGDAAGQAFQAADGGLDLNLDMDRTNSSHID